jgi:uncharacterized phage-associated protein
MSQSQPTYRGTSAAVVYLLKTARENGVLVNRVKLAKLLYLADLRAVEAGLPPGTDVEWRWRHFGPHSSVLQAVENDLFAAQVIQVERSVTYYGNKEVRLRLVEANPHVEIDRRFAKIVSDILKDYGRLSATQLKDMTYQTAPMLTAAAKGKREVRLDLAGGDPYPDLAPALRRLKATLRTMPRLADEDGGVEDLAAEIEEWSPLRKAATSEMVDTE